jgi:hypothetical protein
MRGPGGKDVFARAPGVFDADAGGYRGSMAQERSYPRAAGDDFFTSRMARDLRVFPYGRNIAVVVSAVMNKDRQDAAQKRRAVVRMVDPMCEAKRARGSANAAASGSGKPVPAAKMAAPGGSKASTGEKAAAVGGTKPPPGGPSPAKLPPPGKRVADFGTNISVEDYLVGKCIYIYVFLTGDVLQGRARDNWLLSRLRWQPPRHRRW